MTEQWRPVNGWEGLYEVSDKGRVRSLPRMINTTFGMKKHEGALVGSIKKNNGYLCVNLTVHGRRKQMSIHTLVLEAFVSQRPDGLQAAHRDGDRSNNSLENLRWATISENAQDRVAHGTQKLCGRRLDDQTLTAVADTSISVKEANAIYGVSKTHIRRLRKQTRGDHDLPTPCRRDR